MFLRVSPLTMLLQYRVQQVEEQAVGHELPAAGVRLELLTELCPRSDLRPHEIAGADVKRRQQLREVLRVRALAAPRRPEQDDATGRPHHIDSISQIKEHWTHQVFKIPLVVFSPRKRVPS